MTAVVENEHFSLVLDDLGNVREFRHAADRSVNYVDSDAPAGFGEIAVKLRRTDGELVEVRARDLESSAQITASGVTVVGSHPRYGVVVTSAWALEDDHLVYHVSINGAGTVEHAAMAIPFNTRYSPDAVTTYQRRVVRHDDATGSVIYAVRADGVGRCLLLTPGAHTRPTGVRAELDQRVSGWEGTVWIDLRPTRPSSRDYAWRFDWVPSHLEIADAVYAAGNIDIALTPGAVIPADLTTQVAVRSLAGGCSLEADNPEVTTVCASRHRRGYDIFEVTFGAVGEHLLIARDASGRSRQIQLFATHRLSELIAARQRFLVSRQQYRGGAWFDGLLSNWDMSARQLTTPENPLGLAAYMVGGSDDPTICKAPTLAELALVHPDAASVEVIDYYIDRFVVGGLQRVEETPYPYGVYGSPDWHVHRNAPGPESGTGGHGRDHLWRTFDYTHLIQLYIVMHLLARQRPGLGFARSADEYLDLAFRTATAFFEVPYSIYMEGWDFEGYCDWAFTQGNFHETRILDVISALEAAGRPDDARTLRRLWNSKVRFMLYDHPYPFGSEMRFDSTAFESTYAVGDYAARTRPGADTEGWVDRNGGGPGVALTRTYPSVDREHAVTFLRRQAYSNMAARGMIEPVWYRYGSDIRQHGTTSYALSYMTGLGGGALLDWAVNYAEGDEIIPALRASYGAFLASFALIHTGEDYPWWPHADNRGALSWAFAPQADHTWIGREVSRGPWPLDGENDSGLAGALRAARCVLYDDPLFGIVALGGSLTVTPDGYVVEPRDGVRKCVDVLLGGRHTRVKSDDDVIRTVSVGRDGDIRHVEYDAIAPDAHVLGRGNVPRQQRST